MTARRGPVERFAERVIVFLTWVFVLLLLIAAVVTSPIPRLH